MTDAAGRECDPDGSALPGTAEGGKSRGES
jgi:hypothetical protein